MLVFVVDALSTHDEVDVGRMGGWHGPRPVDELDVCGEPQKVGEGAVDVALLIRSSSLHLPKSLTLESKTVA